MLTKITFRKIIFMAVLLLIIPMIMSAEESMTFDNQFLYVLQQMESGELSMENANERIMSMGEEYSVSEPKMEQVKKMMGDIANGNSTIEECQEQIQTQQKNMNQDRIKIQEGTAVNTQLKLQTSESNRAGKKQ